jgi:TolB protein
MIGNGSDRSTSICSPALWLTRRTLLTGAAAGAAVGWQTGNAGAQLKLDVTQGNIQPIPIAIPDFVGGSPNDGDVARNVNQVIAANLKRSGLFAPIDPAAYIEKVSNVDALPRFADWRTINAQALVTGRLARESDGRYQTDFRLWDVAAGQHLVGQRFSAPPERWRRIGHLISDTVYERLTGQKGYFDKGDD